MSADSQVAVQTSIYGVLTGDATLMAAITGVHDFVNRATGFPYVTIGEMTTLDWSTQQTTGMEMIVTIHSWSQYEGSKELKGIMALIHGLLHDATLSLSGHNFVNCRFDGSTVLRDPDGQTHHGVQRFRVVTDEA